MEIFSQNLSFVLDKINVSNKEIFATLQNLIAIIYRHRRDFENQQDEEVFFAFLLEILMITKYTGINAKDTIQEMVDNI